MSPADQRPAATAGATRPRGQRTRERILDGAMRVLAERGVRGVTLDAVAAETGISKGGLMHHFPTYDALIEGVLARWITDFHEDVDAGSDDADAGAWLRSYVQRIANDTKAQSSFAIGLLVILSHPSANSDALRGYSHELEQRSLTDGVAPVIASIVRLAVDGLWFNQLMGLAAPEGDLREAVLAELERMTRPS